MSNNQTISSDSIYSQIYGNAATNNMEYIAGGGNFIKRPTQYMAKIMDKIESSTSSISSGISGGISGGVSGGISSGISGGISGGVSGGRRIRSKVTFNLEGESEVDAYNYLITRSSQVKQWLLVTHLMPVITTIEHSSIIIIPSNEEIEAQIAEINDALQSAGIEPTSAEASEYIATHPFKFMNYCLNVRPVGDNKGMQYDVPKVFPSETTIRRVARSKGVYYMRFNSEDDIEIGTDEQLSNSKNLKFLAYGRNNVCLLEGVVPEPSELEGETTSTTVVGGGSSVPRKDSYRRYFARLIKHRNGDISNAAYDFVGALGIAGIPTEELAKHYSSNYVHSAFENMFELEGFLGSSDKASGPYAILKSIYDNSKIDKAHEAIQKIYKPRKSRLSIERAKTAINDIYSTATRESRNGVEANAAFINGLKGVYNNLKEPASFKADIATCVVRSNTGIRGFTDACNLVDSVVDCKNASSIFNTEIISGGSKNSGVSTPLMNTVYELMHATPFIGVICKENVPLPVNFKYSSKSSTHGGYELLSSKAPVKTPINEASNPISETLEAHKCPGCGRDPCVCDDNAIEQFI